MLKNMKSKNIKNDICLYEPCFKTALEIKALLFLFVTFHKKIYTQYILNGRVGSFLATILYDKAGNIFNLREQ